MLVKFSYREATYKYLCMSGNKPTVKEGTMVLEKSGIRKVEEYLNKQLRELEGTGSITEFTVNTIHETADIPFSDLVRYIIKDETKVEKGGE